MKKESSTMKSSLKNTGILIIIAIIAVAIPVILKQVLPKYVPKMDLDTVKSLNAVVKVADSDEEAMSGGYFEIDDTFDLEAFNSTLSSSEDQVQTIFKIVQGEHEGTLIIRIRFIGYNSGNIVLLAVKDGVINGFTCISNAENPESGDVFTSAAVTKLRAVLIGKSAISLTEIRNEVGTGATFSANALVKAVNIAVTAYNAYQGGA